MLPTPLMNRPGLGKESSTLKQENEPKTARLDSTSQGPFLIDCAVIMPEVVTAKFISNTSSA
jgi:hypothetical protein